VAHTHEPNPFPHVPFKSITKIHAFDDLYVGDIAKFYKCSQIL